MSSRKGALGGSRETSSDNSGRNGGLSGFVGLVETLNDFLCPTRDLRIEEAVLLCPAGFFGDDMIVAIVLKKKTNTTPCSIDSKQLAD